MLKNIPIKFSLIFWFLFLLIFSGSMLWFSSKEQLRDIFLQQADKTLAFEVKKNSNDFHQQLKQPLGYLKTLRDSWAVNQFVNLEYKKLDNTQLNSAIDHEVESLLKMYLKHMQDVLQISIINISANNKEMIRVVNNSNGISRLAESDLNHTTQLNAKEKMLLNGEHNCACMEIAYLSEEDDFFQRPMHRLLLPIKENNKTIALIIADHDISKPIENLINSFPWPTDVYLFNDNGKYVNKPKTNDKNTTVNKVNFQTDFPQFYLSYKNALSNTKQMSFKINNALYNLYAFTIGSIQTGHRQGLLVKVDSHHVFPEYITSQQYNTWVSLFVLLVGIIIALIVAFFLARPIQVLGKAVDSYAQGIKPDWGNRFAIKEFESLRLAFVEMSKRLNEWVNTLDNRVKERTTQLQMKNNLLVNEVNQHQVTQAKLYLARQVMENASQAVVITNEKNIVIEVNDAYIAMTGFSREVTIGSTLAIEKSGRHDEIFYKQISDALIKENHWEGEVWDRKQNGSVFPKYLNIERLLDNKGQTVNYVAMFEDLTRQKQTEEELEKLTHYDQLTGLSNQLLFRHRLEHEFEVSKRHGFSTALVLVNLSRFSQINEHFGFVIGDELIKESARRLDNLLRKTDLIARKKNHLSRHSDTLARLGGDQFSIILADLQAPENAAVVVRRIFKIFEKKFNINKQEIHMDLSIGIATFPENATTQSGLMLCAEKALKEAKQAGGGQFNFYSQEVNRNSINRFQLETRLRKAILEQEFIIYYQPKIDLFNKQITGMEALIRWQQADGSIVSPADFIPLAEDTGMIIAIGKWVLQQACIDINTLNKRFNSDYKLAVNLSAKQFQYTNVIQLIDDTLNATQLPASQLELEITESMVMENIEKSIETMSQIHSKGISLAIDDFGTGYSSLAYLKKFPVQTLKIDQTFVFELEKNTDDAAIVATICSMGHQLGLSLVAEGIETDQQLQYLKEQNCHFGQGFHMSQPLPLEKLIQFIETYHTE
jgi:PAS domain S-box-containing protein